MDKDELIRQALQEFAEAKDEFCRAHKEGMEALARGDHAAVLQAIAVEFGAIKKQKAATQALAKDHARPSRAELSPHRRKT